MRTRCCVGGLALALMATPALAHPGHGASLLDGLAHPFTGLDHMLAMTAVGLWAASRGGRAVWLWPLSFVGAMLAGFVVGQAGLALPLVEPAILASVIVIGALVAARAQAPLIAGMAVLVLFGAAHGYAHGVEAGHGAGLAFPLGFAVSTLLLHGAGLALGLGLKRHGVLVRALGALTAGAGVLLAFG